VLLNCIALQLLVIVSMTIRFYFGHFVRITLAVIKLTHNYEVSVSKFTPATRISLARIPFFEKHK